MHPGGCGTLHANSAADVPARVEALALTAGLGREAAHSQLASALDVVLHMVRDRGGRRLGEIAVLERTEAGLVRTVTACRVGPDGRFTVGAAADALAGLIEERRR
ncbi:ATPase, T2SS/T4P/T4SS family [Nocardioides ultimimeridianus]